MIKKIILSVMYLLFQNLLISGELSLNHDYNQSKNILENKSIESLLVRIHSKVYMRLNKNQEIGKGKLYLDFKKHRKGDTSNYVQNIIGKIGEQIVFDACYSKNFHSYIRGFPRMKEYYYFKNKLVNSEYVNYTITDNYKNSLKKSFKINKYVKSLQNSKVNTKNNLISNVDSMVWKKTKIEEIITLLYGANVVEKFHNFSYIDIVQKFNPDSWKNSKEMTIYHYKYSPIYFEFKTNKDIESMSILYMGNKNPLLSVYNFHQASLPYVKTRLYLPYTKSGKIILIGKGRDGTFYMSKPYFINLDKILSAEADDATYLYFTIE